MHLKNGFLPIFPFLPKYETEQALDQILQSIFFGF